MKTMNLYYTEFLFQHIIFPVAKMMTQCKVQQRFSHKFKRSMIFLLRFFFFPPRLFPLMIFLHLFASDVSTYCV